MYVCVCVCVCMCMCICICVHVCVCVAAPGLAGRGGARLPRRRAAPGPRRSPLHRPRLDVRQQVPVRVTCPSPGPSPCPSRQSESPIRVTYQSQLSESTIRVPCASPLSESPTWIPFPSHLSESPILCIGYRQVPLPPRLFKFLIRVAYPGRRPLRSARPSPFRRLKFRARAVCRPQPSRPPIRVAHPAADPARLPGPHAPFISPRVAGLGPVPCRPGGRRGPGPSPDDPGGSGPPPDTGRFRARPGPPEPTRPAVPKQALARRAGPGRDR